MIQNGIGWSGIGWNRMGWNEGGWDSVEQDWIRWYWMKPHQPILLMPCNYFHSFSLFFSPHLISSPLLIFLFSYLLISPHLTSHLSPPSYYQTLLHLICFNFSDESCMCHCYPSMLSKSSFAFEFCPSFPCAVTRVNCPSPSSSSPPTLSLLPLSKPGSWVPWTSGSLLCYVCC